MSMTTKICRSLMLASLIAGVHAAPVSAEVTSDRAAAILIFPRVLVTRFTQTQQSNVLNVSDTVVQISNTSTETVALHCFYVDAFGECSISGNGCIPGFPTCADANDVCTPAWTETDFWVYATPRQPLAWRVSEGLSREDVPLDGTSLRGPGGASNAGTVVPPVSPHTIVLPPQAQVPDLSTWTGELKCVVVDADGRAIDRNVVKGEATVVTTAAGTSMSAPLLNLGIVERYNAVGIPAIGGDANGDGVLELGGDAGEYDGCANVLIVDHFFSGLGGGLPAVNQNLDDPFLTLVPCSQDLRAQIPGATTAQFLVFNEFEQRFSTSRAIDCYFQRNLNQIDTTDEDRSIFSAAVAGSAVGQTRIRGVQGGLIGILTDDGSLIFGGTASSNLHEQGLREKADRIVLP